MIKKKRTARRKDGRKGENYGKDMPKASEMESSVVEEGGGTSEMMEWTVWLMKWFKRSMADDFERKASIRKERKERWQLKKL